MEKYDLELIKEIADMEELAELFGLQTKKKGNLTWIECPNPDHHDHHLTNAYIKKTAEGEEIFVCHSCGIHRRSELKKHGIRTNDVIGFVQLVKGVRFGEAVEWLANYYGGSKNFRIGSVEHKKELEEKAWIRKKMPSKQVLELIGLSPKPVYREIGILPEFYEYALEKGQKKEFIEDADGSEYEVVYEKVTSNPLMDLLQDNEPAFFDLVTQRCEESMSFFNAIRHATMEEIADNSRISRSVGEIADLIGKEEMIAVCDSAIRSIENYLIENGIHSKIEEILPKENMFGKIKIGAF